METKLDLIIAAHEQQPDVCQIFQYDNVLLFYPIYPAITKALSYTQKSLEVDPRTFLRDVRRETVCAVTPLERGGKTIGVTYQGFLMHIVRALLESNLYWNVTDMRTSNDMYDFPKPRLDLMRGFRFSQKELLTQGLTANMSGLIGAPTRYGKCLCAGTKVLMFDYTTKVVEDIKVGDKLMGPDGTARTVTCLGHGEEQAYRIIPNKGTPFECNESHILSLKATGGAKFGGYTKGDTTAITVKDYITKSKTYKHVMKLWYAPIEFATQDLPFDPWMVGVWLGDGVANGAARITKPDADVQQGIIEWANSLNLLWKYVAINSPNDTMAVRTIEGNRNSKNPLTEIARMCNMSSEKRIPRVYLTASVLQRLQLLAGLIDTDGYLNNGKGYEIVTKYEGLANDIIQLCRGLGFRVSCTITTKGIKATGFTGVYHRLFIHGAIHNIPCIGKKKASIQDLRVDPTTTGFKVEPIGVKPYYGFEVEGPDKLFLLWDHLVTHNTTLMVNTVRAYPDLVTIITAPGVDLVKQLYADFTCKDRGIKDREIKLICTGSRTKYPSDDGITIVSADSLDKCDFGAAQLLLADEPHALVTNSRLGMIDAFTHARRIGFGATLTGRFDGRDMLISGVFGPVLCERTYKEAVAEGAICPLHVIWMNVELTPVQVRDRDAAYNQQVFKSDSMCQLVKDICERVVPTDWQTMIFIKHEEQAERMLDHLGAQHTIAMAKRMTNKERDEVSNAMRANIIKRCLCTKIYVQGVTFSDVRVLINVEGGGNNTSAIQKPGRLAEIRPNKRCGVVIDFMFTSNVPYAYGDAWAAPCADSKARRAAYEEKGYAMHDVHSVEEMQTVFNHIAL